MLALGMIILAIPALKAIKWVIKSCGDHTRTYSLDDEESEDKKERKTEGKYKPWCTLHLLHLLLRTKEKTTIPFHPPAWPGSKTNWRTRLASWPRNRGMKIKLMGIFRSGEKEILYTVYISILQL